MKKCDICGDEAKTKKAKRNGETIDVCPDCFECEDCKVE